MQEIKIKAPAKINLTLDIKGKREDGYHEVEMIMQSIDLADNLIIRKKKSGINLSVLNSSLSEGPDNLAYQAAELILKKANFSKGVEIILEKKIPVSAGLAGGSTDAAAVLKGINAVYELGFSYKMLCEIAACIGSDVVFCLRGGTALATGRGEKILQLKDLEKTYILLVNPPVKISTKKAYINFDKINISHNIPLELLLKKINSGQDITWTEGWFNVLEPVADKFCLDTVIIKNYLKNYQVKLVRMSGSGPTIFAILKNKKQGKEIVENWPRKEDNLFLTSSKKRMRSL